MAAITPVAGSPHGSMVILKNVAAEIGNSAVAPYVGWVDVPAWARNMTVFLNLTALAGTTRTMDFKILEADPIARNDSYVNDWADWNGITQVTAVGLVVVHAGPGITGVADDDTAAVYKLNAILPPLLGFRIATDRTDADETYTYTLVVCFSV